MIGLPNPRVMEGMWVSLFFLWNMITRTFDSHIHAHVHKRKRAHTQTSRSIYPGIIYLFSIHLFLLSSKCVLQCRTATFLFSFCFVSMLVVSVLCGVSFVVSVVDSVLFFSLCVCVGVCSVAAHSSRSDSKDDLISFLFLSCLHRDLSFCVSVFTIKIIVILMRWVLKFSNLCWCCCLFFSVCVYGGVCRIAEHCSRADSEDDFTAWNYGITTTPHIEWEYVANPDPKKQYTGEFRAQV